MMKEKLARYLRVALRLLYVPKCIGCDSRMAADTEGVLCSVCRDIYENEKENTCPLCAERMSDCLCLPHGMERRGIKRMAKIFFYDPRRDEIGAGLVYALKHRNLASLQAFLAKELAEPLRSLASEGDWIVSYPPRSKRGIHHDGFDHAEALSRALAKELAIPHLSTLLRNRHAVQKTLSREARLREAANTYELKKGIDLCGKRVILCDDVCTTGATLIAAVRLLRRAGAKEVVCAVLAITPPRDYR